MEQIQAFIRLQPMHVGFLKPEYWDVMPMSEKVAFVIDLFKNDIDELLEVNIHVPSAS